MLPLRPIVGYLRKSKPGKFEQTGSLEQQRAEIVAARGEPHHWIGSGDARSGKSDDRDDFQELLQFCRRHSQTRKAPGTIIVWDINRFGRFCDDDMKPDLQKWHEVEGELARCHWHLDSVKNPRIEHPLFQHVLGDVTRYMASKYLEDLSIDTKRGLVDVAIAGWWVGGPAPFGFSRFDPLRQRILADAKHDQVGRQVAPGEEATLTTTLVDNPEEIPHLTWAAECLLAGKNLLQVCRALEMRGVPTPREKRWHPKTLRKMLSNRALIAEPEWNLGGDLARVPAVWKVGSAPIPRRRKQKSADADAEVRLRTRVRIPKEVCKWAPVWSDEFFARIQARLGELREGRGAARRSAPRVGVLLPHCSRCGKCYGADSTWSNGKTRTGVRHLVYAHPNVDGVSYSAEESKAAREAGCRRWRVRADIVDETVRDLVAAERLTEGFIDHLQQMLAEQDDTMKLAKERQALAARAVHAAQKEYETLKRNMRLLDLSDETLRGELEADLNATFRALSDAKQQERIAAQHVVDASSQWDVIEERVEESQGLLKGWAKATLEERREMLGWWAIHVELHVEDSATRAGRNAPKAVAVWLRTNPAAPRVVPLARELGPAKFMRRADNEVSLEGYRGGAANGPAGTLRWRR
ncbi:MAG TPA: recombinase family protein [Gemmatimonadales bacterium]|nr:recombinase family protein [Gemmatimonadales bacterium]